MDEKDAKIAVFRACANAILSMDLDGDAALAVADSFRSGQLSYRLANLLDGLAASEMEVSNNTLPLSKSIDVKPVNPPVKTRQKVSAISTPNKIFDDVKRKKISKNSLFSLLEQINPGAFNSIDSESSMRDAISRFYELSSSEDWELAVDIIRDSTTTDPYLSKMSGFA